MTPKPNKNPFVRIARSVLRPLGAENFGRALYHRFRAPKSRAPSQSETSKCRARLAPFCAGYGVDLGFGGDPIADHAIRVDFPQPYTFVGRQSVQLGGDCTQLKWFRDESLDFVFSSHVLEDFEDTRAVLREWWRVLRPGGRLIIFCPDEQVYRQHCQRTGQRYNEHHVHADFSLAFVKAALRDVGPHHVLHENPLVDIYSWEIVAEKRTSH